MFKAGLVIYPELATGVKEKSQKKSTPDLVSNRSHYIYTASRLAALFSKIPNVQLNGKPVRSTVVVSVREILDIFKQGDRIKFSINGQTGTMYKISGTAFRTESDLSLLFSSWSVPLPIEQRRSKSNDIRKAGSIYDFAR